MIWNFPIGMPEAVVKKLKHAVEDLEFGKEFSDVAERNQLTFEAVVAIYLAEDPMTVPLCTNCIGAGRSDNRPCGVCCGAGYVTR